MLTICFYRKTNNEMKRIFLILFILFAVSLANQLFAQSSTKLVDLCNESAGDDVTYLKDYIVELQGAAPGEKQTPARYSMALQMNTTYRITVCNTEGSQGSAIAEFYDMNRLIGTNYNAATGKEAKQFMFFCSKAGVYHLIIHFQDNKPGKAVCIVSFKSKI